MILRDRPSGFKLFLLWRGSMLPRILPVLVFNVVLAVLVTLTHGEWFHFKVTMTAIPFTLMGLPLAIFLGFRNTAAYDRYWEARKLWGELVLRSRNLSRQCLHLIEPPPPDLPDLRRRMVLRAVAFCHALRVQLRRSSDTRAIEAMLSAEEWQAVQASGNRPAALMLHMGADLATCRHQGQIDGPLLAQIDDTLSAMTGAAASCERISGTPIPFPYTLLLHRTAYIYCLLLPFGLVDIVGVMTPLVVGVIAYTFFALDALGDEIEEPFGALPHHLPLDAMCRAIEINLLEALGETELPPPLKPVDYCLL
ncbi:bestrophin family protein [Macromonas bipunctata]|jgi:ion channel-forming bestrophin family protein|uniref:bestrophin family protein n=1 Tax=Macromonas bipunctata TaxID=183670 RepID=UPI000C33A3A8|nr:bestrophin family ion channel [Macromonas bipunctata]